MFCQIPFWILGNPTADWSDSSEMGDLETVEQRPFEAYVGNRKSGTWLNRSVDAKSVKVDTQVGSARDAVLS
jgi:hypothetical protein